ncbi:MAG: STAS domain-containing protein [Chloroflexi bacterium]|nr:STAS domain-containing protein [Chloroflexota bacterium]
MRIERSSHGNILVIEAGGRVDRVSAEQLGSFLAYEIDAGGRRMVLDLQRVDSMGQDGLWEMMNALKRVRRADGDLRLAQPSDCVREALSMSGLDEIFRIYETQSDAVASF